MKPYQFFTFEEVTYDKSEKRFVYVFDLNEDELIKELDDDELNLVGFRNQFNNLFGLKQTTNDYLDNRFSDFGSYNTSHRIFENLYLSTNYFFSVGIYESEYEDDYKEILDIAIKIAIKEYKKYMKELKLNEEKNRKEAERIAKKLEEITKNNKL